MNSIKISTRIAIAFALALPITFWALGSQTWRALDDYRRAEVVAKQTAAANMLIAGVYEILLERAATNNALQAAQPATDADLKEIATRRGAARSRIHTAYAELVQQDFPNKAAALDEFNKALDRADAYRAKADAAIKMPKADRDADTVKSTYAVLSAYVVAAQKLWNGVLNNTSQLDTELGRLASIRILAWNMRDLAGRERATISQAMAAKTSISADNLASMSALRAQVNLMWMLLQGNLRDQEHPALAGGLQTAKEGYFAKFPPLADQMRKASADGGNYPMPLSQWASTTTALLATLMGVMEKASEASEAHTATLQRVAMRDMAISAGLMVLGLVLLFGAAAFAVFTIARPMRALTTGMLELAAGNFNVVLSGLGRKDEIGDVAGAVENFKVKAAEKARLEAEAKAELDRKVAVEQVERDRIAAEQRAEADRRAAAERDAAAAKVMNEFDAAVGGIVKAAMIGDFSQRVPLDDKHGVVLNLAGALNTMCETVCAVLDDTGRMLGAVADGDLTRRIDADYQGAFGVLKGNANATAERLARTVATIRTAVDEVANAASEISTSTTDLSQRTEQQAASLEQTSASMQELSSTVTKTAEHAQEANQLTANTSEIAGRSGAVVTSAVDAMSRIEQSSRKISDIIGVIDEIARQTNLLALNAAVEAARAGDAGRGFAVVASEVRSLAQRSAQAAKDIKDLITNSSGQVKEGVDLVNRAGGSLNEIVESIRNVADIVARIAAANSEQASSIEQINRALTQMDQVTQQNSALVEENAATAKTLELQAAAVNEQVRVFRLAEDEAARAA